MMDATLDKILDRHPADDVHARLKKAVERRVKSYLWIPEHSITFRPALLSTIYGDGRALFALSTINLRPRYYVLRVDSEWQSGLDRETTNAPDFVELIDEISWDIEAEFGSGRCGYSGANLYWPKKDRGCDCEECSDRYRAKWPALDYQGGCSWSRMDWPASFPTVENPLSSQGNLLAANSPSISSES